MYCTVSPAEKIATSVPFLTCRLIPNFQSFPNKVHPQRKKKRNISSSCIQMETVFPSSYIDIHTISICFWLNKIWRFNALPPLRAAYTFVYRKEKKGMVSPSILLITLGKCVKLSKSFQQIDKWKGDPRPYRDQQNVVLSPGAMWYIQQEKVGWMDGSNNRWNSGPTAYIIITRQRQHCCWQRPAERQENIHNQLLAG